MKLDSIASYNHDNKTSSDHHKNYISSPLFAGTFSFVVLLMDTNKGLWSSLEWDKNERKNTDKDKKTEFNWSAAWKLKVVHVNCAPQIFTLSLPLPPRSRRSQPPEQRGAVSPGSGHGLVSPAQQPGDRLQQVHLAQGHGWVPLPPPPPQMATEQLWEPRRARFNAT